MQIVGTEKLQGNGKKKEWKKKQLSDQEKKLRNKKHRERHKAKARFKRIALMRQQQLHSQRDHVNRPLMKIKIHSKNYLALMDTGSDIGIIGSELFDKLRNKNVKVWYSNKKIEMLDGIVNIIGGVTIKVSTPAGVFIQKFFAIPDGTSQVLLGRDFFRKANVVIAPSGWFVEGKPAKIFPFATEGNSSANLKTKKVSQEDHNMWWAHLLANVHNDQNGVIAKVVTKFCEKGVFSDVPGLLRNAEQIIKVEEGPSYQAPMRPMSTRMRKILEIKVRELLQQGIIEPSESDFLCAPILIKKGKNRAQSVNKLESTDDHSHKQNEDLTEESIKLEAKKYRLCMDMRPVNARLVDVNPRRIQPMDYIFCKLAKAKYFSILDLRSGYFQLAVHKDSRKYLAFRTHKGCFQYTRAAQGLTSSPWDFDRGLDRELGYDTDEFCARFFDDVVVFDDNLEDHAIHLEEILTRLERANLTINPEKAKFACTTVKILGHIVSEGQIEQDPEKTSAVRNFPKPKTKRQVQQFLGMANFLKSFIPKLSIIAKPLNKLTGDVTWTWGAEEEEAFQRIKEAICSDNCVLALPDLDLPFTIITDASALGVGGCLMQESKGQLRPVAFTSRACTKGESTMCATELELLAILHCCQKFESYVQFSEINVQTDHSAIKQIFCMQNASGKIRRWLMKLSHLKLFISYRKGKLNLLADALSRNPDPFGEPITETDDWKEGLIPTHVQEVHAMRFDAENLGPANHACARCSDVPISKSERHELITESENIVQQTNSIIGQALVGENGDIHRWSELPLEGTAEKRTNLKPKKIRKLISSPTTDSRMRRKVLTKQKKKKQWEKKKFISKLIFPSRQESTSTQLLRTCLTKLEDIKNIPTSEEEWAEEQSKDPELAIIKQKVLDKRKQGFMINQNDLLLRKWKGKNLIVVPDHLRKVALQICHDSVVAGHYGVKKTMQKLTQNFSWFKMHKDVKDWVQSCQVCQRIKSANKKKIGFFTSQPETAVGHEISIDIFGKLPRSSKGNSYALVIVDNYSKWCEIFPLRQATSTSIFPKVLSYCLRNGFPYAIRSDNAKTFANNFWKYALAQMGIKQKFQAPFRPQGNISERFIKNIKTRIKAFAHEHKHWDLYLEVLEFALRTTVNESTQYTPTLLHQGRELRNPLVALETTPMPAVTPTQHAVNLIKNLAKAYDLADINIKHSKEKMAKHYDKNRRHNSFEVGQAVLLQIHPLSDASKKFAAGLSPKKSQEVYKIEKKLGTNSYLIKQIGGKKSRVANADQITLFTFRPPHLE